MRARIFRVAAVLAVSLASVTATSYGSGTASGQVARLQRPASPALDYTRLFGGTQTEQGAVVALGSRSNIFLAGTTTSPDWPVPWKTACAQKTCRHVFLLKLSADATSIVFYRVALGGSRDTSVSAIAVDAAGNAYLTGTTSSSNFPMVRPFQARCAGTTCNDGFVAKIN